MKNLRLFSVFMVITLFAASSLEVSAQWAMNGTHIYNVNTGNIGISTGSSFTPSEKLHVTNGTNIASIMAESNYSSTTQRAVGYYRIKNTATGDIFNMSLRKNGSVHEMLQSCYDASAATWREFIYFNYSTRKYEMRNGIVDAEFLNSGNLLFSNTGNIGIGITAPTEKVHINNGANLVGLQMESQYTGTSARAIGYLRIKNTASGDMFNLVLRKNVDHHEMIQSCYDGASSTWREISFFNVASREYRFSEGIVNAFFQNSGNVIFNNTGNIGIGISNPSQKLCVNGKILCKEVEVLLEGWSDFVFRDDYRLKPLSEVEAFIRQNKHLPDVPSEAEILSNGSDLGEMQSILLQKIEELTLYVIELEKKNDLLNERINRMEH